MLFRSLTAEDEKMEFKEDTEATILDDVQPVEHPIGTAPVPPPIVEKKVSAKPNPTKAKPIVEPKVIVAPTPPAPPKKPSTRKYLLWSVLAGLLMVLLVFGGSARKCADNHSSVYTLQLDTVVCDSVAADSVADDDSADDTLQLDWLAADSVAA